MVVDGATGAGGTISGGFGSAESGLTGFDDSFSRFNRAISDSSAAEPMGKHLDAILCADSARDQPDRQRDEIPKINKMPSVPVF